MSRFVWIFQYESCKSDASIFFTVQHRLQACHCFLVDFNRSRSLIRVPGSSLVQAELLATGWGHAECDKAEYNEKGPELGRNTYNRLFLSKL